MSYPNIFIKKINTPSRFLKILSSLSGKEHHKHMAYLFFMSRMDHGPAKRKPVNLDPSKTPARLKIDL